MGSKVKVVAKALKGAALGIIDAYLKINPQASLADLNKAFESSEIKGGKQLLFTEAELDKEVAESSSSSAAEKLADRKKQGYFVTMPDGTKISFSARLMWNKDNYPILEAIANKLGIEVASFDSWPAGAKGFYIIENSNGETSSSADSDAAAKAKAEAEKAKAEAAAAEKETPKEKNEEVKAESAKATSSIDLETLISAALADGVVTEKERSILLKKVKEAGQDVDEFEMLLDARIFEAQKKAEKKEGEKKEEPKAAKEEPKAEKKSKFKDPFEDLMVDVEGGIFTQEDSWEESYEYQPEDKRKKTETRKRTVGYSRKVKLSDFKISKYVVTQKQWKEVMGELPGKQKFEGDNLPVTNVYWDEIQIFIAKLNQLTGKKYHLPTEAQWLFAAMGGNKTKNYKYAGSDNIDEVVWYKENSWQQLQPVGQKKPNELGLYDMGGNVRELCFDCFKRNLGNDNIQDPIVIEGVEDNKYEHVIKGTSWDWESREIKKRDLVDVIGVGTIGFRIASSDNTSTPKLLPSDIEKIFGPSVSESIDGHDYVDLGLPSGLKWATTNIGANTPFDYGDYFAWGEVSVKAEYREENSITINKGTSYLKSSGIIDGKGTLTAAFDAATKNWGGKWRMPTNHDFQELLDNCVCLNIHLSGVLGLVCISKKPGNSNWIFLPAAGCLSGTSRKDVGDRGFYWSSTFVKDSSDRAWLLNFFICSYSSCKRTEDFYVCSLYYGRTVRPVTK